MSLRVCSKSLMHWDARQGPDTDGCQPAVKADCSLLKWRILKQACGCTQPSTPGLAGCPCIGNRTLSGSTRAYLAQETWDVQAGLLRVR